MKKFLFALLLPICVQANTLTFDEAAYDSKFLEQEVTVKGVLWRSRMPVYPKKHQAETPVALISLYSTLEQAKDYDGATVFFTRATAHVSTTNAENTLGKKLK